MAFHALVGRPLPSHPSLTMIPVGQGLSFDRTASTFPQRPRLPKPVTGEGEPAGIWDVHSGRGLFGFHGTPYIER